MILSFLMLSSVLSNLLVLQQILEHPNKLQERILRLDYNDGRSNFGKLLKMIHTTYIRFLSEVSHLVGDGVALELKCCDQALDQVLRQPHSEASTDPWVTTVTKKSEYWVHDAILLLGGQADPATLLKATLLLGCFSRF